MNQTIIDQYENGGEKLKLAIRGLTPQDMLCKPAPDANVGLWSIHQVVIHLMDSDLIGSDRMKRIIAEENPSLIGYDESLFAARLFYEEQSAEDAVTIFVMNRKIFAGVLRRLPEAAFSRIGTHSEVGKVTLGKQLEKYCEHLDHHIKFIHDKRAVMGKEMW